MELLCVEMLMSWWLCTTGGGGNMLLSSVGASPWYIWWNKVGASTCFLCASGYMEFLLKKPHVQL